MLRTAVRRAWLVLLAAVGAQGEDAAYSRGIDAARGADIDGAIDAFRAVKPETAAACANGAEIDRSIVLGA